MRARRRIAILGACSILLLALPAAAQLTTGSVAGTVKDAQGGVVPGATVTLVSDTRGTRSIPVTTDANGDSIVQSTILPSLSCVTPHAANRCGPFRS